MSSLKSRDRRTFEELFGMHTGYVLDFSNNSFCSFVYDEIGIDVYADFGYEEYCSKANKLRQIWADESDYKVANLMLAMLEYFEDLLLKKQRMDLYAEKKIKQLREACEELKANADRTVDLPIGDNTTLTALFENIDSSLKQNKPEFALDRLHTFATKFLREVCINNGISILNNKGIYYPLSNLIGALKKEYEKDSLVKARFSLIAIKNSISLFEQFNDIRNNYSYAHDNEKLSEHEAKYVIKIMAETLMFFNDVENIRKKLKKD